MYCCCCYYFCSYSIEFLLLIVESFIDILQNRSKNLLAIIFDLLASSESDVSGGDDVETSKCKKLMKIFQKISKFRNFSQKLSLTFCTPAPATPRRTLAPAPFIMDMKPSFFKIWVPQSMAPLYLTPLPLVIIIRRRMVSIG